MQDETGKNKMITDEVKEWFPSNAKFELTTITGWDKPDTPLEVQGKLTLPGMAESVGKRVLLPLGLYEAGHPQMFQISRPQTGYLFSLSLRGRRTTSLSNSRRVGTPNHFRIQT